MAATLFIGILTSAFGIAYIAYGRRQTKIVPIVAGIALCAYSYFFDGLLWLCVVGGLLLVAPFIFDY